ncbi:hypothetical protein P2G88_04270 [Aliiglaciecola sp. CAU 1673]|uniref:hypothetical protein n=1 Tax=Aliiglaciecola sp. CAU 1673 TaxID=3032595 RepID=UPI0023DBA35D|nr:hypothetical protein [Aliiglaciecola sp. CAU 1673]MDF2177460.1 hypothetical protein [Aliiglaciecola sp. CAU 1673]
MKISVLPLVFLCLFAFNLYENYSAEVPASQSTQIIASDADMVDGQVSFALDSIPSVSAKVQKAWDENEVVGTALFVVSSVILVPWFLALCAYMLFNLTMLKVFKPRNLWPQAKPAAGKAPVDAVQVNDSKELVDATN